MNEDDIRAAALDVISECDFWGITDECAQKACSYIDGVKDLAERCIAHIKKKDAEWRARLEETRAEV